MTAATTTTLDTHELERAAQALPPLPQTTSKILSILEDPMYEVKDLIKVVSLDPTLTASLLRVANSAGYCRGNPAGSVGEAIVRVGTGTILALAVVGSARPEMSLDLSAFGTTIDQYWNHTVGTVAAAEEMNSRRIARFGSGFSTAALLHDFGKLILVQYMTPDRIFALSEFHATHPGHRPIEAEQQVLQVDHATAGAIVARRWNLPEAVAVAIEHHHSPVDWEADLTNGLIVANRIASNHGSHEAFAIQSAENLSEAMLALGIEDATYDTLVDASGERFNTLIELFDI